MTEKVAAMGQQKNNATKASHKKKSSSLMRCMKAPLRALRCARDMYVKSLGGCAGAGGGGRGAPMTGVTAGMVAMMPRARSVNAFGNSNGFGGGSGRDDDFKELIRANSKQDHDDAAAGMAQAIKRSQSVAPAIGRIDEDAPCDDFDGDIYKLGIPRSKSCAVVPTARRINILGVTPTA
ncbi:uncharacterized protein LOC110112732 [Dendrobium catenatum]|uniref:uncharacterized protein LOC110112732 n=1 Tax=Dendrobium catenatum TaxID=906689 RepID=UPI0009F4AC43|nr:uncharacterized protein LOC110112732 [Dendrobium catenatum]